MSTREVPHRVGGVESPASSSGDRAPKQKNTPAILDQGGGNKIQGGPGNWPAARVAMWRIAELRANPANARTHSAEQIESLKRSMVEFGWTNPVLVDTEGLIIAGHGRVRAALELGYEAAPVMVAHGWTAEQIRAYALADNALALQAGWDAELLKTELSELQAAGYDLGLTGFTDEELRQYMEPQAAEGETDPDEIPDPGDICHVRRGDVWLLGAHRLCCGDACAPSDMEKLLNGAQADVVWTEPPYGVAIGDKNEDMVKAGFRGEPTSGKIQNDDLSPEQLALFLRDAFTTMFLALKAGAPVYVAHADSNGEAFRQAFRLGGFKLASCLIWRKHTFTLGRSDYQWQHEPILYGWKPGSRHRWYGGRKNSTMQEFGAAPPFVQVGENQWAVRAGDRVLLIEGAATLQTLTPSIVEVRKPAKSPDHPTTKPVELVETNLKHSARSGDLVLDPFAGSGTTLIAADRLGMASCAMEIEPRFCQVIIRRWQAYTGRRAVHEETRTEFPNDEGEKTQAHLPEAPGRQPRESTDQPRRARRGRRSAG